MPVAQRDDDIGGEFIINCTSERLRLRSSRIVGRQTGRVECDVQPPHGAPQRKYCFRFLEQDQQSCENTNSLGTPSTALARQSRTVIIVVIIVILGMIDGHVE